MQASICVDMIMGNRRNFSAASFKEQIVIKHKEDTKWVQRVQHNNHPNPVYLILEVHDKNKNSILWLYCYIL